MSLKPWKILSVGGSIIIPKTGFDVPFLKSFRDLIVCHIENGERFIITIGGGATCRQYQQAAGAVRPLTTEDLDWLGIATTKMNATFVQYLFKEHAHGELIENPTKKMRTKKSLLIGAGWKPGASTDYDAVLLAKTHKAKEILNLSNIAYVYDRDPKQFKEARALRDIDWKSFRRDIVGDAWEAGKNVPFDPTASKLAERMKLIVSVLDGTNLTAVDHALTGQSFPGTVIHP